MTYVDPSSDPLLAGLPPLPAGAGTGTRVPIGVPKGYTAKTAPATEAPAFGAGGEISFDPGTPPRVPLYFEGDEYNKAPLALQDVADLQRALVQVGFLDKSGIVYGSFDGQTASAFKNVLAIANQSGTQWQDALATRLALVEQQGGLGETGRQVPPLTIKLSNPDDLAKTAQNVASTLMGGKLSDDDVARFVSSYQGMEAAAQQQQYAQNYNAAGSGPGAGGTLVAPPDKTVAAEKQIRTEHPLEVAQQGFVDAFDPLLQTLTQRRPGGGVG